jgi:hypothetical protein
LTYFKERKVRFVVFSGTSWQKEEREIENLLRHQINSNGYDISKGLLQFDSIQVLDLKLLKLDDSK